MLATGDHPGSALRFTCRISTTPRDTAGIARQPYYRWLSDPVSDAASREAHLANAIFEAHRDDT